MSPLASVRPADSREHEIKLLVDLVRLSRVTVLYAEAGAGQSSVIRESVVPLLERAQGAQTEVPLLLDTWSLPALRSRIDAAVVSVTGRPREADRSRETDSLVGLLRYCQETLGITFILIFDRFEEYLSAPVEPSLLHFEEQFVEVVTDRSLRTHVLLSLDEAAAPLLGRLQSRIPGLGDARVRLPRAGPSAPSADESGLTRPLFFGSAPSAEQANRGESLAESLERVRAHYEQQDGAASTAPLESGQKLDEGALRLEALHGSEPTLRPTPPLPSIALSASAEAPGSRQEDDRPDASTQRLPHSGRIGDRDHEHVPRSTRRAWVAVALAAIVLSYWLFVTRGPGPEPAAQAPQSVPAVPGPQPSSPEAAATAASSNAYGLVWDETPLRSETDYSAPRDWLGIDTRDTAAPPASLQAPASEPRRSDPVLAQATTAAPAPAAKSAAPAETTPPSAEAPSGPLLFIHVRNDAQRARAQRMIAPLAKRGIRVSGIRLVSFGPPVTDLRYFRASERDEAAKVARALREIGVEPRRLNQIAGLEAQAVRRQYELWLPEGRRESEK